MANGVKVSELPDLPGAVDGTEIGVVVKGGTTYKVSLASTQKTSIHSSVSAFPSTGTINKLYLAEDTGVCYIWNGTEYVPKIPGLIVSGNNATLSNGSGTLLEVNDGIVTPVKHRIDTLSNLLGLAGKEGEISVASDIDALVKHTGVAGEAKAFFRNTFGWMELYSGLSTSTHTNTSLYVPFDMSNAESLHSQGTTTDSNGFIVVPSWSDLFRIYGRVVFDGNTNGTLRRVKVEGRLIANGQWYSLGIQSGSNFETANSVEVPFDVSFVTEKGLYDRIRLLVNSDSGTALTVESVGRISVEFGLR